MRTILNPFIFLHIFMHVFTLFNRTRFSNKEYRAQTNQKYLSNLRTALISFTPSAHLSPYKLFFQQKSQQKGKTKQIINKIINKKTKKKNRSPSTGKCPRWEY